MLKCRAPCLTHRLRTRGIVRGLNAEALGVSECGSCRRGAGGGCGRGTRREGGPSRVGTYGASLRESAAGWGGGGGKCSVGNEKRRRLSLSRTTSVFPYQRLFMSWQSRAPLARQSSKVDPIGKGEPSTSSSHPWISACSSGSIAGAENTEFAESKPNQFRVLVSFSSSDRMHAPLF